MPVSCYKGWSSILKMSFLKRHHSSAANFKSKVIHFTVNFKWPWLDSKNRCSSNACCYEWIVENKGTEWLSNIQMLTVFVPFEDNCFKVFNFKAVTFVSICCVSWRKNNITAEDNFTTMAVFMAILSSTRKCLKMKIHQCFTKHIATSGFVWSLVCFVHWELLCNRICLMLALF